MIKWFTEKKIKWFGGGWPVILFRTSRRIDEKGRKILLFEEMKTTITKAYNKGLDGIRFGVKK
jgi:hypothetical protein